MRVAADVEEPVFGTEVVVPQHGRPVLGDRPLQRRLDERWPGALRVGQLFDLVTVAAQAEAIAQSTDTSEASAPATYEF